MKTLQAIAGACGAGALILACAAASRPTADDATVVLGSFDSRSVAIAYAGSELFGDYLSGLRQELERAKASGNEARAADLEALGPALQEQLHRQGFSTGPIDDILAHIEDQLPAIAKQAGVDVIASQWDLVYQHPDAQLVDVTEPLVAAFDPDEKTLRSARQIRQHDPVPADQLSHDH